MKKYLTLLAAFILIAQVTAQENAPVPKKGWNVGFLPAVAYDSDLGIYYGIIVNPFDYGDGSVYPDYLQSVYLQISGYSKGSSEHALEYESYSILPGIKFTAAFNYRGYKAYPFYGFNGNESIYRPEWEDETSSRYKTRMFYRIERKNMVFSASLQDTIGNSKFRWQAGWATGSYRIAPVNIEKMNSRLSGDKILPDTASLFDNYVEWGLISENEKEGGIVNTLIAGLVYDSRDRLTNPQKGIFTEINLRYMPSFLTRGDYSDLSLGLIHRQYLSLIPGRLIFAYRVWFNMSLAGSQPFYARQQLVSFKNTQGFGGSSTLRGVLMQRIVTRDFLLATGELRSRLVNFRFINQNWYFGAIAFMDAGRIIKPLAINLGNVPLSEINDYFAPADKSVHKSAGTGIKLAMNENFVLSAEYAVAFDRQDGISGLYLGLNYQF